MVGGQFEAGGGDGQLRREWEPDAELLVDGKLERGGVADRREWCLRDV